MKIALSVAIAFSFLTGVGAYAYLDAAAATAMSSGEPAHAGRSGAVRDPISQHAPPPSSR